MLGKESKHGNVELSTESEWLFFYLLHQRNCGLVEQDVKADHEAKSPSKRCIKRYDLRFRRRVKSLLKEEVVFMVARHQQAI